MSLQVGEDLLEHSRVFNAGDDLDGAAALQISMSILKTRFRRCLEVQRLKDDVRGAVTVGGLHAVDDPQHLPHDRRAAGEQKAQLIKGS